ncbi:MAG: signal peptidase I [Lentisphaeria bacterium]|nr:signal peptidase I [Lentisphaeria bacterium]
MLRTILPIILEILAVWFFFGHALTRLILPKRKKNALTVKEFHHHLKKLRVVNRDLLSREALAGIDAVSDDLDAFRKQGNFDEESTAGVLRKADAAIAAVVPRNIRNRRMPVEYLEIIVVALGVAFGIRAIFLQPFKIPTGSMQPTLYGIHFVPDDDVTVPATPVKLIHWFHSSKRYVDQTIQEGGFIRGYRQVPSRIPFFPRTAFVIGGREYILPGKPVDAAKCNPKLNAYYNGREHRNISYPISFSKDDILAKGALVSGDHVFVNRTAFNFAEPKRGDITVFMTDGIFYDSVELKTKGRYYIKRLAGLPGDTLMINENNQLLIKEPGDSEFRLAAGEDNPAFRRLNSGRGGYHGHVADMGADNQLYLLPGTSFTVPANHYFMLGDNSAHSLDSRFWGPVPRENLVGKASLVWWPASRRWGVTDTVEPADDAEKATSSGRVE